MRPSLDSLMTPYALSPASRITAVRMNRREFFGEGVVWITQGPISGMSDRSGRKHYVNCLANRTWERSKVDVWMPSVRFESPMHWGTACSRSQHAKKAEPRCRFRGSKHPKTVIEPEYKSIYMI